MRTPILEYHDVVATGQEDRSGFPGPSAAAYKVTPDAFLRQLEFLGTATEGDGALHRARGQGDAGEPWLLTFDDGGASATTEIAPLLETRGYRGHFFIATGMLGHAGFLSGAQVQELLRRGHRIGSHSHSHPLLMARLSAGEIREEWTRSTGALEQLLGEPVVTASVPGGYFSTRVAEAASMAGITQLYTSEPTARVSVHQGVQVFGRYVIRRGQAPGFAAAVVRGDGLTVAREGISWNAKKALKAVMGDSYVQVRDLVRRAAHRGAHSSRQDR